MITMVIIAAVALLLTFSLMRSTARGTGRERADGIRWRGIDWSAGEGAKTEAESASDTASDSESASDTDTDTDTGAEKR